MNNPQNIHQFKDRVIGIKEDYPLEEAQSIYIIDETIETRFGERRAIIVFLLTDCGDEELSSVITVAVGNGDEVIDFGDSYVDWQEVYYGLKYKSHRPIQETFPSLSPREREFIKTGIML